MVSELLELNQIRLTHDLSYDALAADIRRITRKAISGQTVYRILTTPNARVNDRTLVKIRTYLVARRRVV